MKSRNLSSAFGLTLLAACACNAPDGDSLFGNAAPAAGSSTGGGGGPGGGGVTATGGVPAGGGLPQASGGALGSGGVLGPGGALGSGGAVASGGVDGATGGAQTDGGGGTAGASGGAGGASDVDAGPFDASQCQFTGAFASYVRIPVKWPATVVLLEGTGFIEQWSLTLQEQAPGDPVVKNKTYPCGITLPDLQSNFFQAGAKFGIRFLDPMFDRGVLPHAEYKIQAVPGPNGSAEFVSQPFALVMGLVMNDPVNDPWPTSVPTNALVDDDRDQFYGVRVSPAEGRGYALPPVSVFDDDRAKFIDIIERTVQSFHGTIRSCDDLEASFDILTVAGKPAIDSTVIGCQKRSGTICTSDEAQFIDVNRPDFAPTGPGKLLTHRIPDGSVCKDVRAYYPSILTTP